MNIRCAICNCIVLLLNLRSFLWTHCGVLKILHLLPFSCTLFIFESVLIHRIVCLCSLCVWVQHSPNMLFQRSDRMDPICILSKRFIVRSIAIFSTIVYLRIQSSDTRQGRRNSELLHDLFKFCLNIQDRTRHRLWIR